MIFNINNKFNNLYYLYLQIRLYILNKMEYLNRHRYIFNLSRFGIDIFDTFGRYNYHKMQSNLPKHSHQDMVEVCYLVRGHQSYFVGEERFDMYGGDIFITHPGEMHGTGSEPEEKGALYWFILKMPREGVDFLGVDCRGALEIFNRLNSLPKRLFKIGIELELIFKRIISIYTKEPSTLNTIELKNQLLTLLLEIIQKGETQRERQYSLRITETLDYIDTNIFTSVTLEGLAKRCSLSLSRFKHLFKVEVGIPPSEYIMRRKMDIAKELVLCKDYSISDVAYELDFSSASYFSTVFKQYHGLSPKAIRDL